MKAFLLLAASCTAMATQDAAAAQTPACTRLGDALDAWSLERAVALEDAVTQELNDPQRKGCAQVALASLALQRGSPQQGVRWLRQAAASSLDAPAATRGADIEPRLFAAAALAEDAHDFTSQHFWVRAHHKDEVVAAYALDVAERALTRIGRRLGWPENDKDSLPIGIEFYPTVKSLAQATGLSAQAIETSGTIAVCKEHRLLLLSPLATASGYAWADTLAHELTHLIVGRVSHNKAPVWLQEGIAKTYEVAWRGEPAIHTAHATERRMRLAARHNELISLKAMSPSVALLPSAQHTALAFAEVSSLIDGIRRRVGDAPIAAMLKRLEHAPRFEAAWQPPLFSVAQEEARWRRHVERLPLLGATDDDEDEESLPVLNTRAQAEAPSSPPAASDATAALPGATGRALRLGELLALEDRWGAAIVAYERAQRASPRPSARIERALARALTEAGRTEEAMARWTSAAKRAPQAHDVRYWLGLLLAAHNRCNEAVPHLSQFCLYNPFVVEVHEAWAQCAAKSGDERVAARETRFAALCREPRDTHTPGEEQATHAAGPP